MTATMENFMGLQPHDITIATTFGRAVADQLRRRHAFHTAKEIARRLEIGVKAAENILDGHLSSRTMTLIVSAYGPGPIMEAAAAVTGHTLETFITEQAAEAERAATRAEERAHELRTLRTRLQASRGGDPGGDGLAP